MNVDRLRHAALVIGALLVMLHASPARAHGGHGATTETRTQVLGGGTFTVTLTKPAEVPALVSIDLVSLESFAAKTITIHASLITPSSLAEPPVEAHVVPHQPGQYHAEVMMKHQGTWLLDLQVTDQHGSSTATIPVMIGTPPPSRTTVAVLALTTTGAMLMLGVLPVIAVQRRRCGAPRPQRGTPSTG